MLWHHRRGERAGPVAGPLIRTSPTSVRTVLGLDPLRTLPDPDRSPRSWPRCSSRSAPSAVSSTCRVSPTPPTVRPAPTDRLGRTLGWLHVAHPGGHA